MDITLEERTIGESKFQDPSLAVPRSLQDSQRLSGPQGIEVIRKFLKTWTARAFRRSQDRNQ